MSLGLTLHQEKLARVVSHGELSFRWLHHKGRAPAESRARIEFTGLDAFMPGGLWSNMDPHYRNIHYVDDQA